MWYYIIILPLGSSRSRLLTTRAPCSILLR